MFHHFREIFESTSVIRFLIFIGRDNKFSDDG